MVNQLQTAAFSDVHGSIKNELHVVLASFICKDYGQMKSDK